MISPVLQYRTHDRSDQKPSQTLGRGERGSTPQSRGTTQLTCKDQSRILPPTWSEQHPLFGTGVGQIIATLERTNPKDPAKCQHPPRPRILILVAEIFFTRHHRTSSGERPNVKIRGCGGDSAISPVLQYFGQHPSRNLFLLLFIFRKHFQLWVNTLRGNYCCYCFFGESIFLRARPLQDQLRSARSFWQTCFEKILSKHHLSAATLPQECRRSLNSARRC